MDIEVNNTFTIPHFIDTEIKTEVKNKGSAYFDFVKGNFAQNLSGKIIKEHPIIYNSDINNIYSKMLERIPNDIDKSQNGLLWDFTRPTAIEKSEMIQFVLLQVLMNLFPSSSKK